MTDTSDLVRRLRDWWPKFAPADSLSKDLHDAADRLEALEAALRAIMEAHGPGTLASEEIYEQAVTALNGPRPKWK